MAPVSTKILYSVTGHGYGHASRSLTIADALRRQHPGIELTVSSPLERSAFEYLARPRSLEYSVRNAKYEPGTAQKNCFEVDVEKTRELYRELSREHDRLIEEEAAFLTENQYHGVISDVTAITVAAAARVGIPAVVVSNFTWDWILESTFGDDGELQEYRQRLASDYSKAGLYLRLPFHAPSHPFSTTVDVPLVGRQSLLSQREARSRLGVDAQDDRPLVLVAVGGWQNENWPSIAVDRCAAHRFLVVDNLPIRFAEAEVVRVPFFLRNELTFPDLVRAVDVGIVKPGYGTCAEFALNDAVMIGIERRDFREYRHLVPQFREMWPFREMAIETFFSGNWSATLAALEHEPLREATSNASQSVAARLADFLSLN